MKTQGDRQRSITAMVALVLGASLLLASQASATLIANGDAELGVSDPPYVAANQNGTVVIAGDATVYAGAFSFLMSDTAGPLQRFARLDDGVGDYRLDIDPTKVYFYEMYYQTRSLSFPTYQTQPHTVLFDFDGGGGAQFIDIPVSPDNTTGYQHFIRTMGAPGSGADLIFSPTTTHVDLLLYPAGAGPATDTGMIEWDNVVWDVVPEPSTAVLLGLGALLGFRTRRPKV